MTRLIVWNAALIVVFGAVGLILFTENVRTIQIIGLIACGMVIGGSLTAIVTTVKSKQ